MAVSVMHVRMMAVDMGNRVMGVDVAMRHRFFTVYMVSVLMVVQVVMGHNVMDVAMQMLLRHGHIGA